MKFIKRISFIFFLCLALISQAQQTKKVLFIGNSYTGVNNLPNLVYQIGLSTNDTLIYDSNTPGGARFLNHASNSATLNKIAAQDWDYVVLQAQSQEASWPPSDLNTVVFPYAKILSDSIKANNICSKPLFYTTWGRKNGDAQNCNYAPHVCTYEGMDSALTAAYTTMAALNAGVVSPVGPVWRYLRQNSGIELYASDGSHPSLAGSYAAACTFYAMIFEKEPTTISWNSSLNALVADSIKAAAKLIAYDSLAKWDYSISYAQCDSLMGINDQAFGSDFSLFPNPTKGEFSINLAKPYRSTHLKVLDIKGRMIYSQSFNNRQILKLDLDASPGMYFLLITSDGKQKALRLFKQ